MELDRIVNSEIEQEILYSAIEDEIDGKIKLNSKSSHKKKKRLRFKKEIKIRTLLLLIITLIMNTYAWFIYITTVSVGLGVHIKNWNFVLENDSQAEDFEFVVDNIYPGVPVEETVQSITASNNGEIDADLECTVKYIRILDKEYSTSQEFAENPLNEFYTSQQLLDKLYKDYPFKIKIYLTTEDELGSKSEVLYEGQEVTVPTGTQIDIKLQIEWPYEASEEILNNTNSVLEETDQIDTYWGEEAYKYHKENPDKYSILVKMDIRAVQKNGE